jgi:hypothetical protein
MGSPKLRSGVVNVKQQQRGGTAGRVKGYGCASTLTFSRHPIKSIELIHDRRQPDIDTARRLNKHVEILHASGSPFSSFTAVRP